jgi:hypothetical protein
LKIIFKEVIMKCNIGKNDKIIRTIIAVLFFAIGIIYQTWWGLLGVIPLATVITGFCGFYVPLKINTLKKEEKK